MIGSRRREKKEDEPDDGLHKNKTLLEYQNKCLCTLVDDLKLKLSFKEKAFNVMEKRFNFLLYFMNNFNDKLIGINSAIELSVLENNIKKDVELISKEKKNYSGPAELIKEAIENPLDVKDFYLQKKDTNTEKENKMQIEKEENIKDKNSKNFESLENIKKNYEILIKYIFPILKMDENSRKKNTDKISEDILEVNKTLEGKIKSKQREINDLKSQLEIQKIQTEIPKKMLEERNIEYAKIDKELTKFRRIAKAHPICPSLILFEEATEKPINAHDCLCIICGKNCMPKDSDVKIADKKDSEIKEEKEEKDDFIFEGEKEKTDLLVKENEALKKRIIELHNKLENSENKYEISEENLLSSKHFKALVYQAENILTKLQQLKEANMELTKKNNYLNEEKQNEVDTLSNNFLTKIKEFEKTIYDSSKVIESDKIKIQLLLGRIDAFEKIIKDNENNNHNSFYDVFEKERSNLTTQINSTKTMMKEYKSKYDEEKNKNRQNELEIFRLKSEITNLKAKNNNNSESSSINKNTELLHLQNEKIEWLKKENEKLTNEVNKERNNYERMIEISEMNEKGFTDLNNMIKTLKNEISENKEIQAKMSNSKLKDSATIQMLKEEKNLFEIKLNKLQETLDNYKLYFKKTDDELKEQKNLNKLYEQERKIVEIDMEKLKKFNIDNLKTIEKQKHDNELLQNELDKYKTQKTKQCAEYDVLKIKYEQVCKLKNHDPNEPILTDIQGELDMLKEEHHKYWEMVHCKICRTRIKNAAISKCGHCFCKECVEDTFQSRRRKCPLCREQITQNDVHDLYLD